MLGMFAMIFKCFSGVSVNVSDAYFKCFICFLLYVAIVSKVDRCYTWDAREKRLAARATFGAARPTYEAAHSHC
jgi:hypothetical protein